MRTLGSDRASSKGYIVRWVEAPSNKLLTTMNKEEKAKLWSDRIQQCQAEDNQKYVIYIREKVIVKN